MNAHNRIGHQRTSRQLRLLRGGVAAAALSACDTMTEEEYPTHGTECVASCEVRYPEGLELYETVITGGCICEHSCSDECRVSVCTDKDTPSDECLPCVQEALTGAFCDVGQGLFGACTEDESCSAFIGCVTDCIPTTSQ